VVVVAAVISSIPLVNNVAVLVEVQIPLVTGTVKAISIPDSFSRFRRDKAALSALSSKPIV